MTSTATISTAAARTPAGHWCSTCRAVAAFEQPDCGDGHATECPDWVCVACGDAFVMGFPVRSPRDARRPGGRRGPAGARRRPGRVA